MSQAIIQILQDKAKERNGQVWLQKFYTGMGELKVRTLDDIATMSPQRCYLSTLGAIAKNNGEQVPVDFLTCCIVDFLEFLTLPDDNTMGRRQIDQTVELILEDPNYRSLTIEDYKLFFNRAKRGEYGKIYGRIDGQTIIMWLDQYMGERCQYFSEKSIQQAESLKERDDRRIGEPAKIDEILKSQKR